MQPIHQSSLSNQHLTLFLLLSTLSCVMSQQEHRSQVKRRWKEIHLPKCGRSQTHTLILKSLKMRPSPFIYDNDRVKTFLRYELWVNETISSTDLPVHLHVNGGFPFGFSHGTSFHLFSRNKTYHDICGLIRIMNNYDEATCVKKRRIFQRRRICFCDMPPGRYMQRRVKKIFEMPRMPSLLTSLLGIRKINVEITIRLTQGSRELTCIRFAVPLALSRPRKKWSHSFPSFRFG